MVALVRLQLGRHGCHPTAMEQVQEQCLDHVVHVMTERNLGKTLLGGIGVERAPS